MIGELAAIDPLNYARIAKPGKWWLFLFSTHDEYFPLEGLEETIDVLKARGEHVYVLVALNNDHYKVYRRWLEAIPVFLNTIFYNLIGRGGLEPPKLIHYPFIVLLKGAYEVAWRPAITGLPYLEAPPVVVLLSPIQGIGFSAPLGISISTGPIVTGRFEPLIVLVLSIILSSYLLANRPGSSSAKLASALSAYTLSILPFILPYIVWSGRFTLTLLQVYERYGIMISDAVYSGPLYPIALFMLAFTALIAPPLVFLAVLVDKEKLSYPLLTVIALLQITLILASRMLFLTLSQKTGITIPASIYCLEAFPAVIAVWPGIEKLARALYRRRLSKPVEESGKELMEKGT